MTADPGLFSLNSGEVSRLALGRVDLAKMRVASERHSNFLPHVLGPTMLRPGTAYIVNAPGDAEGWLGEFYFSETEKALLVMTAEGLSFLVDGQFVTRPGISASIVNTDFAVDLSGWTVSDEPGAASDWASFTARLTGTGTNYAQIDQQVTVFEPDVEHALRVWIARNDVRVQIGSSQGDDSYFGATLAPGIYSLAFTPSSDFWVRLGANSEYPALVEGISVEPFGRVVLPVPYSTKAHFDAIRYDQSGDVLFVACPGFQQRRIERRASDSRSWGIALYQADDGPFRLANITSTTITPSTTRGAATLTANRSLFRPGHVGSIWRLTHTQQKRQSILAAINDATGHIRVAGLTSHSASGGAPGNQTVRRFSIEVSGTFNATIELQKSLAEPGAWGVVSGESYTGSVSKSIDDGLDNQIIFYRLVCTSYTSGSAIATLIYDGASQDGVVRINEVAGTNVAYGDVLQQLGDTAATSDWAEGEWSDYRGWPGAVALHDGRLAWFQNIKAQLSVSDAYHSFDPTTEGDSGPINRTIATGGADGARWGLSLQRLIMATAAQEISIRASAFDEPLTPTQFTARVCSTRGAGNVRAVKADTVGVFVERNGARVFELVYDVQLSDYRSRELTRLKQEMCSAGVVDLAVQRQPDTRFWLVLADGTCAVLTYDQDDEVVSWTPAATPGAFERVAVLPGSDEDDVYFMVRRTINGATKRYIEKLAKRSECQGGFISKAGLDSHIVYSGALTSSLSGLDHLEGQTVGIWANGAPVIGQFTVSGGQIPLPGGVTDAVVGLQFTGQIKLAKLAFPVEHGTGLTAEKRVSRLGLVMADLSWQGVRIGRDFENMTGIPATYRGRALNPGEVLAAYDMKVPFNGAWDSDSRICIQVTGPHCCTILGVVPHMEINEPVEPPPPSRQR